MRKEGRHTGGQQTGRGKMAYGICKGMALE